MTHTEVFFSVTSFFIRCLPTKPQPPVTSAGAAIARFC